MSDYRRLYVPGGTYFFTVVTEGRASILCDEKARGLLRQLLAACRERWPFRIEAIVLLPDHLHALWSLPEGDANYSQRWAWIKKEFTKGWLDADGVEQARSKSRVRNRRRGVWQRRFWEHAIRDENDFERHADYLHYNPVKHGLVKRPCDWPYSTIHQWVKSERYPVNWGCDALNFDDLDDTAMEMG